MLSPDEPGDSYRCYAVRRLNPFRGVIQIIANRNSRAFTLDGRKWEIQLLARRPDDMWGAPSATPPTLQFIRFGHWHPERGVSRIPAHPLLDLTSLLPRAQQLADQLTQQATAIPFPLYDRFELWLLDDRQQLPLALLASSCEADRLVRPEPIHWRSANRGGDDPDTPRSDHNEPRPRLDGNPQTPVSALDRLVANTASHCHSAWYLRAADGSGEWQADAAADERVAQRLDEQQFPPLLLREQWPDYHDSERVAEYLQWQAPRLLTLQRLSSSLRSRLEQQARQQALLVERHHRFYPRIIDRAAIDTARVEARIRQTG